MIKVFQWKSLLSQILVKNDHFIKENHKICIFLTIIHYFEHLYMEISLNFAKKFYENIKFTIRTHTIYLKLNFIDKNDHFQLFKPFTVSNFCFACEAKMTNEERLTFSCMNYYTNLEVTWPPQKKRQTLLQKKILDFSF